MSEVKPVTVLMVEDDEIDRKALRRAFQKAKIANPLVFAENGVEALKILRGKEGFSLERPYILLVDLNMPRMSGLELLKEIRADKKLKDVVVFVLTTSKDEDDIRGAYNFNVAGYIVKSDLSKGFLDAVTMLRAYWKVVELPE